MLCPSCNGQIYPLSKSFVCPHCFLQLQVQKLKRLTIFLLPDNRLAGIYNATSGRTVSFMGFVTNPPIQQQESDRQQASASLKLQHHLNQISKMLTALKSEQQTLVESEVVIEYALINAFGLKPELNLCRSQVALACGLIEKLERAYLKLRDDLQQAASQPPSDVQSFKLQIQQQVQLVRQLESQKNSALRGLD